MEEWWSGRNRAIMKLRNGFLSIDTNSSQRFCSGRNFINKSLRTVPDFHPLPLKKPADPIAN